MPSETGTLLLEEKLLDQSVVARAQHRWHSIQDPKTGQGTLLLSQKIILLFAVMRNGFALIPLRAAAVMAGTGEGSARQQHKSLCEWVTLCSEQTVPSHGIG